MNLVEIGGSILNAEAVEPFIKQAHELGHAYMGALSSVFAMGFAALENDYGIYKPKVWSSV